VQCLRLFRGSPSGAQIRSALRLSAYWNNFCVAPGQRSGDAVRGPIGNGSQWIVSEMRVACCRLC